MKTNLFLLLVFMSSVIVSCHKTDDNHQNFNIGFEEKSLESGKYWNGSDKSGANETGTTKFKQTIAVGEGLFYNEYESLYGSWQGFAFSNMNDTITANFTNQYSAYAGSGADNSSNFAVSYGTNTLEFSKNEYPVIIESINITNVTYVAYTLKNGDMFSKKFGGLDGKDSDWFKLIITGINANGKEIGKIETYLADFQNSDNRKDYVVKQWKKVDLSSLGELKKLKFELNSSDVGSWGMNTPAYFCIDNIKGYYILP